jgi:predicted TIM-barrel fold metal-dependent hydrolase
MRIDCHNHPDWHGHDLKKFLADLDEKRIDKSFVLSWECNVDEYEPDSARYFAYGPEGPIPFSRCLSYVERAPDRFLLGYAPDPRKPDACERLRAMTAIYGVQMCGELKLRMMYDDLDALRMYRVAGELGLPVLVHIDYEFPNSYNFPRPNWWYGGGIEPFARAVAACPDTVFVGHAPGFWAHISNDDQFDKVAYPSGKVVPGGRIVQLLDRYPNLFCDTSGGSGCNALTRDPAYALEFLTKYQDRILFGRDDFNSDLQDFLDSLPLPADVRAKIDSGNLERLLAQGAAKRAGNA